MTCPHCGSAASPERADRTALGYRRFRCHGCRRGFHERTGTPFNRLQYPTDVVCLVVLWRFRYKLSLRDLAEMFLQRGIIFTHEAVREWEHTLAPLLGEALRKRRHGTVGQSWYVDETYIRGQGRWCYLYRAIDRDGHLIDTRLSDTRDLAAAEAFFRSAWTVTGMTPDRITTDGHDAYPRAIRNVFGNRVTHRTNRYLNNHLEQDHRGIKQRYRVESKNSNLSIYGKLRAIPCLAFGLSSAPRSPILTVEQGKRHRGTSDGLEAPIGLYHGLGR